MSLKDLDVVKLSKLASQQIDQVTCLECCKYYIAPATAACGHTLCHACWRGRRTCPTCAAQLERKTLKLNLPLQSLTEHVQKLGEAFEKLFNIKLDEFNLDTPGEQESEKDPDKNVKDWLTSSQNHFSAPIQNSEAFSQDVQQPDNPLEISASNIIIHTNTKKVVSPPKVVYIAPPQDDWDKIEPMQESEVTNKKKEIIVGPMDIEPFFVDDDEYNMNNPRRSSRKKDVKTDESNGKIQDTNKQSSRDSSGENENNLKVKQNWNNVKRMRKEFSKLNKKNRSKLNVSIEMVKKTQTLKPHLNSVQAADQVYSIDDNTPSNINKEHDNSNENSNLPMTEKETNKHISNINIVQTELPDSNVLKEVIPKSQNILISNDIITENSTSNMKNILNTSNKANIVKSGNNQDVAEIRKMPFIKKSALNPKLTEDPMYLQNHIVEPQTTENTDDIEISIKVGNTITNIVIKKKQSDVQVKINTDREVQTSLGPHNLVPESESLMLHKDVNNHNIQINVNNNVTHEDHEVNKKNNGTQKKIKEPDNLSKSTSGKKNTASADTGTAQFEITESVEKELSKIMECDNNEDDPKHLQVEIPQAADKNMDIIIDNEDMNDLDIFNSGSVKEANVHVLKEHAPSEILISTVQSRLRTQRLAEKRDRDNNDEEKLPKNKRLKVNSENNLQPAHNNTKKQSEMQPDSEPINYDSIMDQVFANIDADMEDIRKSQEIQSVHNLKTAKSSASEVVQLNKRNPSYTPTQNTQTMKNDAKQITVTQRHSENVFSIIERDDEQSEISKIDKIPQQLEELLTPVACHNLNTTQNCVTIHKNKGITNTQRSIDSDKSVVEETPQKDNSIPKLKRASTSNISEINLSDTRKVSLRKSTSNVKSIINITDSMTNSIKTNRDVTVIENAVPQALETPLTITKFADQIKHKSTPMARKSLNFDQDNDEDPEQTLCPTSDVITKTTQEKEFMRKAFENTPTTPAVRPLMSRNIVSDTNKKYNLAGSCLSSGEIAKVKMLCNKHKWNYFDKYSNDITHLIVGVDEENKSQRSVKYMCALAASKWIVSFDWIKTCLQSKDLVNEAHYEALDSTGEPGPKRSRIAKKKLFEDITFYCMPPFSVLDVDALKAMLRDAGGRVVDSAEDVRITDDSMQPALLLAEPENTQEDRFTFLAMEKQIVPVNFEWVLNCLGNYTLGSIHELLLCPSSLLPAATGYWPEVLMAQDYD